MSRLPKGVSARRFIKALVQDGFVHVRTRGSHRIYRNRAGQRVVVAYHALSDTFPIGTLQAMVRDIGWTEDDLRRFDLLD